jgi:hypothetical protein
VEATGAEAQVVLEESACSLEAVPAEPAKELLSAVTREQQSRDHPDY